MSNRWLRFVLALFALTAAAAAGYRIVQLEQRLAGTTTITDAGALAGDTAIETISEMRAALHAYVAPGQGRAFWISRAAMLLDKLRSTVIEIDGVATALGVSPTDALDLSDRLAASEQRARDTVAAGQALLGGEVIFTEARDQLDTMRLQIARTRGQIAQAADTRRVETRREQSLFALGAASILALALLLLVPPGRPSEPAPVHVNTIPPIPADPRPPSRRAAALEPATQATPVAPLAEAADLCTSLARVSDSGEISALLTRVADVLHASGIIIWMASENRGELVPAASAGYDDRLFARIGAIPRDASNLTARAFREEAARTCASSQSAPAAIAVPLMTPEGAVGVFSAEIRDVDEVDPQRLAVATIFAAQLAMLLGSMTTAGEAAPPAEQHAQG